MTDGEDEDDSLTHPESGIDTSADDLFAERVLESMREMFWAPEIARRGGIKSTGPVYAALAILMPGQPVEVRLNDEVNRPEFRGGSVTWNQPRSGRVSEGSALG